MFQDISTVAVDAHVLQMWVMEVQNGIKAQTQQKNEIVKEFITFGFWSSVLNLLQTMSVPPNEQCLDQRYEASFVQDGGTCPHHVGWCVCVRVWRQGFGLASVGGDLRNLRVSRLVGGLNEHWLGQLLSRRHRHLLNLIQLLWGTETETQA